MTELDHLLINILAKDQIVDKHVGASRQKELLKLYFFIWQKKKKIWRKCFISVKAAWGDLKYFWSLLLPFPIDLPLNWEARINLSDSATSSESILACSLSKKSNLDENFVLQWILKDEAINC